MTYFLPASQMPEPRAFGWNQGGNVYIRADLPFAIKEYVFAHEDFHTVDKSTNVLWREIKANAYALWRHPWGFVLTCLYSLSWERLAYYWERMREKK